MKNESVFLNDWKDSRVAGLIEDFGITEADLDGVEIILASYTYEAYEGEAFVLFSKGGQLYEVNGNHCSCFGLSAQYSYGIGSDETQWQPEKTSIKELQFRLSNGDLSRSGYEDELKLVLDKLDLEMKK